MSVGGSDGKAAAARVAAYEAGLPRARVQRDGHVIELAIPTRICLYRATSYFEKEPETIRWIAGMPAGSVLFDVGANIGLYTLWAGVTREARVFAFEPEAGNYATLNTNIRLNGLSKRCLAFCVGVADRVGFDVLHVARPEVGQSGHQVGLREAGGVDQGVAAVSLDHLVYEANLPCPSYLKIDVDGLEPAIIRGARRLLEDRRLTSILIELAVMLPEHRQVIDLLEGLGFVKDEALLQAVYAKTKGVKHTGNVVFTRR